MHASKHRIEADHDSDPVRGVNGCVSAARAVECFSSFNLKNHLASEYNALQEDYTHNLRETVESTTPTIAGTTGRSR